MKKLLVGLALSILGATASAQELNCSQAPNGPMTGTPSQCLSVLTTYLKNELASHGFKPCNPFYDTTHTGTTNGQYWQNDGNGLWTLYIWSYAENSTNPNNWVVCSSPTEQAWPIGQTVDTYSSAPGNFATISGNIPLDGTPIIVGSVFITTDWGSGSFEASQTFVPQSPDTTYHIVYNAPILQGGVTGGYYTISGPNFGMKVYDWTGKDVTPTLTSPASLWSQSNNDQAYSAQVYGDLTGVTNGNPYTVTVTGTAYAGGTGNHGSFAIGTISVLGQ